MPDTLSQVDQTIDLRRDPCSSKDVDKLHINRLPYCAVCTEFDVQIAEEITLCAPDRVWLHVKSEAACVSATLNEVLEAAESDCPSCSLLRSCVVMFVGEEILQRPEDVEIRAIYGPGITMILEIIHGNEHCGFFELFTVSAERCPWPNIGSQVFSIDPRAGDWPWPGGIASPVPLDPTSPDSFSTLTRWIDFCRTEHPWCNLSFPCPGRGLVAKPNAPTRLLYVGESDEQVRLCPMGNEWVRYTVLSYCWGSTRKLLTLKANLGKLQSSTPVKELVETCQDAIRLTRRLGFKYCWIDSLCIIQDDLEDWQAESARMASIYANADICIAATATDDGHAGFLNKRAQTRQLKVVNAQGEQSTIWARAAISHHAFNWWLKFEQESASWLSGSNAAKEHPLFTRGWAFQERLLSPRILHFTKHEMVWECLGSITCECGTLSQHVNCAIFRERRYLASVDEEVEVRCGKLNRARELARKMRVLNKLSADRGLKKRMFPSGFQHDEALMHVMQVSDFSTPSQDRSTINNLSVVLGDRWRTLVRDYSSRQLSYAVDALPALSGLANKWAALYRQPTNYLAGLWQHDLRRNLLWKCVDTQAIARPSTYLAPSWSWASMRRVIEFLPSNYDPVYHVTIEEATCEPSSPDPFGTVSGGFIKLRGRTIDALLVYDSERLNRESAAGLFFDNGPGIKTGLNFVVDCVPECRALHHQTVRLLWYSTDVNDLRTGRGHERALVLAEKNPQIPGVYTRIGLVSHMPPPDEWKDWNGWRVTWKETRMTIL